MPPAVYEAVKLRSESDSPYPVCEAMIRGVCTGTPEAWHHRQMRSQGGKHEVVNGFAICAACHSWIHAHPSESYEHGWLVHGWDDPATRIVMRRGHWVQLREDGNYVGVKF